MKKFEWNAETIGSMDFKCGYCGNIVASEKGWRSREIELHRIKIYICPHCCKPNIYFSEENVMIPGAKFGKKVEGIDDILINEIYEEARRATSANCYTAAVLCCRKILMHVAVSKKAEEGKSFLEYVEYLSEKNYVPPDGKKWVDHIRKKGNEANHEIVTMKNKDAEDLISFTEMLLKFIYEFPNKLKENES